MIKSLLQALTANKWTKTTVLKITDVHAVVLALNICTQLSYLFGILYTTWIAVSSFKLTPRVSAVFSQCAVTSRGLGLVVPTEPSVGKKHIQLSLGTFVHSLKKRGEGLDVETELSLTSKESAPSAADTVHSIYTMQQLNTTGYIISVVSTNHESFNLQIFGTQCILL